MKKIIRVAMAIVVALGLMSFTAADEFRPDFGDSKAVYSGPCGNYSVDVNTLTAMYYMLPANIRKDFDKAYDQSGYELWGGTCTLYGVTMVSKRVDDIYYDYTITYQDHTIKINHIRMSDLNLLFNWVPLG